MTSPHRLRGASMILATAAVLALAGCVLPTPIASTPGSSSTLTATPTPTVTVTPSPTAGTPAQPVAIACSTLISAQTIYDFNPNFTLQASYALRSGSAAATAKALGGTACTWVNETSGDTVSASVAKPGSDEFATLRKSAAAGTPVAGYGDAAYFAAGRIDVFSGANWVVLQSTYFSSAADASTLLRSALAQAR